MTVKKANKIPTYLGKSFFPTMFFVPNIYSHQLTIGLRERIIGGWATEFHSNLQNYRKKKHICI